VLTGDNITGLPALGRLGVKASIEAFMEVFDRIYEDFGVPMTMVFGNHDGESPAGNKEYQFSVYAAHKSFIGRRVPEADAGAQDQQGPRCGTHNLVVNGSKTGKPAFNLWLFDSGSYEALLGGYSGVRASQVEWFKQKHRALGNLPSIAFQHIVVPEVFDYLNPDESLPAGVEGELRERPCPAANFNGGQYEALCQAGVAALFVGHDHVNSYELRPRGRTHIVNTPCAGFGSYGDADLRGVRVITLDEKTGGYETEFVTYEGYYGQRLPTARLLAYQHLKAYAVILDYLFFKPFLAVRGLFS
jgi:hypothetical protein